MAIPAALNIRLGLLPQINRGFPDVVFPCGMHNEAVGTYPPGSNQKQLAGLSSRVFPLLVIESQGIFFDPIMPGGIIVNSTRFVITSISSIFCHTCMHWRGDRVIQKGHSKSWSHFLGGCEISSGEGGQNNLQVLQKRATDPGCEKWLTIQTN